MATFNNIINADIHIDTHDEINYFLEPTEHKRTLLFTFDLSKTNDNNIAYTDTPTHSNIYYLDRSQIYNTTKKLGKYILKNHQLTTLYYMRELEKMVFDVKNINQLSPDKQIHEITTQYTNIGILSDKVGAGKSYCVMALLNEAKNIQNKKLPFRDINYGVNDIKINNINKLNTNILLVPHSLVGQWKKYLDDSDLKFATIQRAKDIFTLADETCTFKNGNFKIDNLKEDDETIPEEGEEPIKKKKPIKKVAAKASTKAKKVTKDNGSVVYEPSANEDVEINFVDERTSLLEQKKQLNEQLSQLSKEYNNLVNSYYGYSYNSNQHVTTRSQMTTNRDKHDKIKKQVSEIITKINRLGLVNGSIKIKDIQELHKIFAVQPIKIPDHYKQFVDDFGNLDKEKVENLDVILLSASFYNLFTLYINKEQYTINRLIIDECNSVKGSQLVEINRVFTWLITSSIKSMMTSSGYIVKTIQQQSQLQGHAFGHMYNRTYNEKTVNSTGLILNMIKELYKNCNNNCKLYLVNNPDYINESMSLPEMKTFLVVSKDNLVIQVLGGIVSHDILQMLNAGDIDGIVAKLDVTVDNEPNIIDLITCKYLDELKVKEYELKVAIENPKYNPEHESTGVINKRAAIAELKNKISCIKERISTIESCPICYDDFTNPAITPCCSNKFCFDCITMVLNNKHECPLCKSELNIKNVLVISNKSKKEICNSVKEKELLEKAKKTVKHTEKLTYEDKLENLVTDSHLFTKYDNMDKIFELNATQTVKKYLIFTEYESALNEKITNILNKWELKYARIKGAGTVITELVNKYKNGNINVLLINSKYFGSGMNLENTSDIIIIHKMQSDIEMQVIGRAQRYGREGSLRVWKLYYQNECQ